MKLLFRMGAVLLLALPIHTAAVAQSAQPESGYDETLAQSVGADEHGMKKYVLVILKTGPHTVPKGPERDAMFNGHFANMQRLVDAGKLVVGGPTDNEGGWRGIFLFATGDIAEAQQWVATDPVIINGEMVAEYHHLYSSAALMLVAQQHKKLVKKDVE